MDASTCSPSLHYCASLGLDKQGRRSNDFLRFSQTLNFKGFNSNRVPLRSKLASFELSCAYNHCQAPALELEKTYDYLDGPFILKKKSQDVAPYINKRCVYLVGMMGSGKTTVGKILSDVLGYSFLDSDKLVEQAVGVTSVAQIFEDYSESFFRDNESEVLRELTSMTKLVVATGGGAVIRPVNWKYMKQGITVWLDVPLEALARRIAAVGTDSRPLLHGESGDPYTKALTRLSTLSKERGEAYANADARVCLENIAAKLGHGDVNNLTPTTIAIEVLIQMENFLKGEDNMTIRR